MSRDDTATFEWTPVALDLLLLMLAVCYLGFFLLRTTAAPRSGLVFIAAFTLLTLLFALVELFSSRRWGQFFVQVGVIVVCTLPALVITFNNFGIF